MTDKLEGIKPGDRVRVTFEANLPDRTPYEYGAVYLSLEGQTDVLIFAQTANASHFQIERIEPPLKVGDTVLADRTTWWVADIRQTAGGTDQVAVWNDQDGYSVYERADLERIA